MKRVDIDTVPVGSLVYDAGGFPLGWIGIHLQMNGNYAPSEIRVLNNGRRSDSPAYRRAILYKKAKEAGVYVAAADRCACRKGEK